ncbi:MAG: twin-arginine translocation signal domain-containing protein [Chloroflexi bacterium]|nr:twin-arginine translocation signal domain-containing protein [Chloroflexota bacterium]
MLNPIVRKSHNPISRRDFLKLAALGAGAIAFRPFAKQDLSEFPQSDHLGRVTVGKVDVFVRPDANSRQK